MDHVPVTVSQDPSLRRAIALAVALCSFGAGFLAMLLNERPADPTSAFGLVTYFGLLAACWFGAVKGWTGGLYALAALGLALVIACIAIRLGIALDFTPQSPWRWYRLVVPAVALLVSPFYIRRFWKAAGTRAGQG
jgi:hypothetical protein